MNYRFFGSATPPLVPNNPAFARIRDQYHLYDLLCHTWCAETCAPRLRKEWSSENKTLGQCSITAFLVQDIFGGEVYGVPLPDGNFHCFNKVGNIIFDLTSEQFGNVRLDYQNATLQKRETHFEKEEKYLRYLRLKEALLRKLD
ncbi:MAG: hypothetical protein IJS37_05920 [Bacilli bacterium]|nr:hypothetical protein [Bacilli bacterium]